MVKSMATYRVRPARETPRGFMCLSECDQTKAVTHAPTIYFYPPVLNMSLESVTQILRKSLSEALVLFYPLAGRLHWIGGGRLELDCNASGAVLVAVESEAKIHDFGDFRPTPEIRSLIPSVDYAKPIHEQPLLLVQVTKFSCGGISLGLGISHIMVDGIAALNFILEWAKISRGEKSSGLPFLDRSVLRPPDHLTAPSFDHPEYHPQPLLIGKQDNMEERARETTTLLLKLTKDQIQNLKDKANKYQTYSGSGQRSFTRYEAVAGHIWRSACKARDHESQQPTTMSMVIDARNRMQPPLPPRYFGNAAFRVSAVSTAGELIMKPLGYAAGVARRTIEKATHEYFQSSLVCVKNHKDVTNFRNFHTVGCANAGFYGNPNIEVTSWIGLPLYGADFGWGQEIYMGPGAVGFDGKIFVLSASGQDGSFVVVLRLQVRHIDAFRKFFYQDI